jgi:hypothetical protein
MVIKVVGCDDVKVSVPAVAVEDVPVTCGNEVEIDLAILLSALTPFWMTTRMSVNEEAITFVLREHTGI